MFGSRTFTPSFVEYLWARSVRLTEEQWWSRRRDLGIPGDQHQNPGELVEIPWGTGKDFDGKRVRSR